MWNCKTNSFQTICRICVCAPYPWLLYTLDQQQIFKEKSFVSRNKFDVSTSKLLFSQFPYGRELNTNSHFIINPHTHNMYIPNLYIYKSQTLIIIIYRRPITSMCRTNTHMHTYIRIYIYMYTVIILFYFSMW